MSNALRDSSGQLSTIDYTNILKKIEERINEFRIVCNNEYIDFENINTVIKSIIDKLKAEYKEDDYKILGIDPTKKPIHLTLNHKDYEQFAASIKSLFHKIPLNINCELLNISDLSNVKKDRKNDVNFGINYFLIIKLYQERRCLSM